MKISAAYLNFQQRKELTDAEKEEFLNCEEYDSKNYWWEFSGNELTITYVEERK